MLDQVVNNPGWCSPPPLVPSDAAPSFSHSGHPLRRGRRPVGRGSLLQPADAGDARPLARRFARAHRGHPGGHPARVRRRDRPVRAARRQGRSSQGHHGQVGAPVDRAGARRSGARRPVALGGQPCCRAAGYGRAGPRPRGGRHRRSGLARQDGGDGDDRPAPRHPSVARGERGRDRVRVVARGLSGGGRHHRALRARGSVGPAAVSAHRARIVLFAAGLDGGAGPGCRASPSRGRDAGAPQRCLQRILVDARARPGGAPVRSEQRRRRQLRYRRGRRRRGGAESREDCPTVADPRW